MASDAIVTTHLTGNLADGVRYGASYGDVEVAVVCEGASSCCDRSCGV